MILTTQPQYTAQTRLSESSSITIQGSVRPSIRCHPPHTHTPNALITKPANNTHIESEHNYRQSLKYALQLEAATHGSVAAFANKPIYLPLTSKY